MRNMMQALVLGLIGILLASPLTSSVARALSPQKADANGHVFTQAADRTWLNFVETLAPWIQVVGIALGVVAAFWLASRAVRVSSLAPGLRAQTWAAAVVVAVGTFGIAWTNPPTLTFPGAAISDTVGRASAGVTGGRSWDEPSPAPSASPTPGGTTSWGN